MPESDSIATIAGPQRRNIRDISGRRCGKLVAVRFVFVKNKKAHWLFRCDCGKEKIYHSNRAKEVGSCGCGTFAKRSDIHRTHGRRHTTEYSVWRRILERCADKNYPRYGDRGISVCEQWRTSFMAFYNDMGPRPSLKHSIDRINNDGNYEPGNCRWATAKEQARNRVTNTLLTFNGKTQCIESWADDLGLRGRMIAKRISLGWTVEDALTRKPRRPADKQ